MKRNVGLMLALAGLLAPLAAVAAGNPMAVSEELDVQYVYTGGASTRGAGLHAGSVSEHSADVKYVFSPQVTKDLLLRFGFEWQRFSFNVPRHVPVPDTLQQVSAVIGLDYQLGDQWLVRAELEPGMYSDFEDSNFRDFNAPLVLGAAYLANADLQWFFGLRVDLRSHNPVLPAPGVRWKFADEWTLNLVFPNPRLEYDVNDRFQVYLGASVESGTFVVGDRFGSDHGVPKLDHATLDYMAIRVGPGCLWKVRPNLTMEAGAGFLLQRRFDFFDQDTTIRNHEAPYLQIVCHARF
jgi:opacity protein-like surface antigen